MGNITGEPMFVDPLTGDFRLLPGSPAIDAGGTTTLTIDYYGNPRPYDGDGNGAGNTGDGSEIDIGAFELGPNSSIILNHLLGHITVATSSSVFEDHDRNLNNALDSGDLIIFTNDLNPP